MASIRHFFADLFGDDAVEAMKGYRPVVPWSERAAIVESIRLIDGVIADESSDKRLAWHTRAFDVLFKGDDFNQTDVAIAHY